MIYAFISFKASTLVEFFSWKQFGISLVSFFWRSLDIGGRGGKKMGRRLSLADALGGYYDFGSTVLCHIFRMKRVAI